MTWIQTYTGRAIDLDAPDPAQIHLPDIAHALSHICRFTGHTWFHYSVAQHSVLVSQMVEPEHALWGLLHDAHEAYVNDIAAPFKRMGAMKGYREIADRVDFAVRLSDIGIHPSAATREAVKIADLRMLMTEARQLLTWPPPRDWGIDAEPYDLEIVRMDPEEAEAAFLRRFDEVTG